MKLLRINSSFDIKTILYCSWRGHIFIWQFKCVWKKWVIVHVLPYLKVWSTQGKTTHRAADQSSIPHIRRTNLSQEIIFDPYASQLFQKMISALSFSRLNTPSVKEFAVCLCAWWMVKLVRCNSRDRALINTFCSLWINDWSGKEMQSAAPMFECYSLAGLSFW